jgi:ankyrin repeat protein
MKYIRLYEERLKDYEIMSLYSDTLIDIIKEEINKQSYDAEYIKDLVSLGHFDINQTWGGEVFLGKYSTNLLIAVTERNDIDLVKFLLEEGADPNVQTSYGDTALMKASYMGYTEIVKELLKHPDINPNIADIDGYTALMGACEKNNITIIDELLKHRRTSVDIMNLRYKRAWDIAKPEARELFPRLNPGY